MAHNRLEKIGTIYTRVTGLIRAGSMKLEDRPIWYEIYEAFPPSTSPTYARNIPDTPIREIFYPEDSIRAMFYKKMPNSSIGNLTDSKNETFSQRCIKATLAIAKEQDLPIEEAFTTAFNNVQNEMEESRTTVKDSIPLKSSTEKGPPLSTNLKNIFNET